MTEEQIFIAIFKYIEHLFATIRPKKLFFMAVDGVAPRAKINQQRSRRFRTAHEASESIRLARERGETLPDEEPFDSNCITPGTEFMEKLSNHLCYFVHKKLNEDDNWKGVKIVLSGQEVPGEGEHKIMEYIRLARSQPDYDPNTRHCIYGLDADLIMLGLLTHDPHFCLLREEVTFGSQKNKSNLKTRTPDAIRFYLLHLSLFREYLDLEFSQQLKYGSLSFEYDLERIIDDFILMSLFVGNDFLPNLPSMHINEGALTVLFDLYKKVLPTLDGYLNINGKINFQRLQSLLNELSAMEKNKFLEDNQHLIKEFTAKSMKKAKESRAPNPRKRGISRTQKQIVEQLKIFSSDTFADDFQVSKEIIVNPEDRKFLLKLAEELNFNIWVDEGAGVGKIPQSIVISRHRNLDEVSPNETEENEIDSDYEEEQSLLRQRVFKSYEKFNLIEHQDVKSEASIDENDSSKMLLIEFENHRANYYAEKINLKMKDKKQMKFFIGYYAQGLQWVMYYYYLGVQSWGWYFPYHYAPMVSDLYNLEDCISFVGNWSKGKPFLPFEQLLGVLPPKSIKLIPAAYHDLVLGAGSPIGDFYPDKFETDLNGKKNDWEAVVKIPFIDEKRLLNAMKTKESMLSKAEKKRNSFGSSWVFEFFAKMKPVEFSSPLPDIFPPILHSYVKQSEYKLPTVESIDELVHGLVNGVKLGVDSLPGFPTLYTLDFESFMMRHGVKVFGSPAKSESIIIRILPTESISTIEELALKLVGRRVHVGWPYLKEAVVVGISNSSVSYQIKVSDQNQIIKPLETSKELQPHMLYQKMYSESDSDRWIAKATKTEEFYSQHCGVLIGEAEVLVDVSLIKGLKRLDNGAMVKNFGIFSDEKRTFPLQLIIQKVKVEDPRFKEKPAPPINVEFPEGTEGFYIGDGINYGRKFYVSGYSSSGRSLKLLSDSPWPKQPLFPKTIFQKYMESEKYVPMRHISKILGISGISLSKIASSAFAIPIGKNDKPMEGEKTNIGLNIKYDARKLKVVGYSRFSINSGWELSDRAVQLIKEYNDRFPQVLEVFSKPKTDFPNAREIFGDAHEEKFKELKQWLKDKKIKEFEKVAVDVEILPGSYVQELESQIALYRKEIENAKAKEVQIQNVPAQLLLLPSQANFRLSPFQSFKVGDRVVFVLKKGSVPCGATGTTVGVEKPAQTETRKGSQMAAKQNVISNEYDWVHVLFDIPFMGGTTLDNRCSTKSGLLVSSNGLLNLTNPQPPVYRKFAGKPNFSKTSVGPIKKIMKPNAS